MEINIDDDDDQEIPNDFDAVIRFDDRNPVPCGFKPIYINNYKKNLLC